MREVAKSLARLLALIGVSPVLLYYAVARRVSGDRRPLESCTQALALIPGLPGQFVRRAFLSRTLAYCGPTSVISFGTTFAAEKARIGDGAYIGSFCTIGLVDIGADVLIASGVQIPSGRHTHGIAAGAPMREQTGRPELVHIGAGSWIGNNAVVMADVGAECVIGAGAVVTRPIPAHCVAAGVPARVIRRRDAAPAPAR